MIHDGKMQFTTAGHHIAAPTGHRKAGQKSNELAVCTEFAPVLRRYINQMVRPIHFWIKHNVTEIMGFGETCRGNNPNIPQFNLVIWFYSSHVYIYIYVYIYMYIYIQF